MILAVTGHRSPKLHAAYDDEAALVSLQDLAEREIRALSPDLVLSGMALGWDTACAAACIALKIPFNAYIPFYGQESEWPPDARDRYHALLDRAAWIEYCSAPGYAAEKFEIRNQRLVRGSNHLLALWNGKPSGTGNCVAFARNIGRATTNCWERWLQLKKRRGIV